MRKIVIDQDPRLFAVAGQHLGRVFDPQRDVVISLWDDYLLAIVVYFNYTEYDIEMAVVAFAPNWLSRTFLAAVFGYPFEQLGCDRVTGRVLASNVKARTMDERLGFRVEGVLRRGVAGEDVVIYGMLREECRWIHPGGHDHQQEISTERAEAAEA